MVFSSIPAYLDPPNWHQQQNQHQANGSEISQLLPPLPGLQPHAQPAQPTVVNQTQTQTQAQAQVAKIPPSETALKCPRCESTNTKFCYFNNYSLSQPRHFCKTCRRYWTRGGALRNVPVGGGCRRNNNKKSKRSTRSKSPVSNDKESFSNSASAIFNPHEQIGQFPQPITNRPYMTSLQNLSRYGIGVGNIGHMGVQNGIHSSTAGGVLPLDQWRFQQFPFLNNFESTSSGVSYPFQSEIVEASPSSRVSHQLPSVKVEYNNGGLNLLRSPLSISENNPYNSWTDFSALASSSASHLL